MTDKERAEELTQEYFQRFGGFTCSWGNVQQIIGEMLKENEELKAVCDYNCPGHKLATHNACLTCPAVRNSPYHDLKNVSDEELQQIIKDAETEMEM